MNAYGVLTTKEEIENAGLSLYNRLDKPGVYRLRLDYRCWYSNGRQFGLVANFSSEDGNLYRLYAWRHRYDNEEIYNPKKSRIDFAKVFDNTWWDITIENNKKGNAEWTDAVLAE